MKKLTALIAMVLCLTIGGVYAAWIYTNPANDLTDERLERLITISTATEEGAAGTYGIETNITGITIDQMGTNSLGKDYHTAVLNYTTDDGKAPIIRLTLKLKENTGSDIFDTLESTYSIQILDVGGQYKGADIFVDKKAGMTEVVWEYDEENDIYYYEIDVTDEIALAEIVLASKSEHTAFSALLGRPVLEVKLSDGKLPSSN